MVFLDISLNMISLMTRWKAFTCNRKIDFQLKSKNKGALYAAINWIDYWTLSHMQLNIIHIFYYSTRVYSSFFFFIYCSTSSINQLSKYCIAIHFVAFIFPQWLFIIFRSLDALYLFIHWMKNNLFSFIFTQSIQPPVSKMLEWH